MKTEISSAILISFVAPVDAVSGKAILCPNREHPINSKDSLLSQIVAA